MSLAERGEIDVDTTARSLLEDELPLVDNRVTVEQLLAHRSGIGDYLDEDELTDNNDYALALPAHELATAEQFVRVPDGHPTKFKPGERFSYSNGGYIVLALLAERTTGEPFHDIVEQRVWGPAGMTSHRTNSPDVPRSATSTTKVRARTCSTCLCVATETAATTPRRPMSTLGGTPCSRAEWSRSTPSRR